jgi:hypothetical protein
MSQSDTASVEVVENTTLCKNREPKNRLTYMSQIFAIYFVLVVSIIQLCLQSEDRIWLILLSSTLGYILPTPGLKFIKQPTLQTLTQQR